ncbi:MAG TPA: hypothetical protein VGZ00_02310 [Candidatus Baltobacteraceae bacterium]|jgi:hypothetical protein|nr:hypothetical protein [Candidatus Baltobacteraceae bacterium]
MYKAIALIGHKGAGKDLVATYLEATREHIIILPAKTPVVKKFERTIGHRYEKKRDDDKLMRYSSEIARKEDPNIVVDWLDTILRANAAVGRIPVIPGIRFPDDNDALMARRDVLCLKIHASEETCRQRVIKRDGTDANFQPKDPSEISIDKLDCHHQINNERNDDGREAILHLEKVLSGLDVSLARNKSFKEEHDFPHRVRIVDPESPFYWETGFLQSPTEQDPQQLPIFLENPNRAENFPTNAFVRISVLPHRREQQQDGLQRSA